MQDRFQTLLWSDGAVRVCPATSMETVMNHGMGERKKNDNQNDNPDECPNSWPEGLPSCTGGLIRIGSHHRLPGESLRGEWLKHAPGATHASCESYCRFRRLHISSCRQHLRQIQTRDADPIVGHAVVDIEAIR